jgi:hypothetical protein
VEAGRCLVHFCAQRLQHTVLGHEAGEDLLAEWVVLISPDQSVISELGRAALEWKRVQFGASFRPHVVRLWKSAAHHSSVLCNSRHGQVHNLAVLDRIILS